MDMQEHKYKLEYISWTKTKISTKNNLWNLYKQC